MSLFGTACEMMPSALQQVPLMPKVQSKHQLNMRIPTQSAVFIAVEYALALKNDEQQVIHQLIQQQLYHSFADVYYAQEQQVQPIEQWFAQATEIAPQADYVLVLRLVEFKQGNIIRQKACDKASQNCKTSLASGRDELRLESWLYTVDQQRLIDQGQAQSTAGLFGWQLETVQDLLKVTLARLVQGYAG